MSMDVIHWLEWDLCICHDFHDWKCAYIVVYTCILLRIAVCLFLANWTMLLFVCAVTV